MKSQLPEMTTSSVKDRKTTAEKFLQLREVIRQLRSPGGCPWDREQDFSSMKPKFLEEVYELVDALEQNDLAGMREELGDLFFHLLFMALLGEEGNYWTLDDVLDEIAEKLIRRHPHVFTQSGMIETSSQVLTQWDEIKKQVEGKNYQSLLDNVPRTLPPLQKAYVYGKKGRKVGFDWRSAAEVLPKVYEELQEVEDAMAGNDREALAEELGDLFLVMVSLARHLDFEPEGLVRAANRKFDHRFREMERIAAAQGTSLEQMSLEEKEILWQAAKKRQEQETH
ncbi:MAG: nucleoside triphosphate pyrophosphohydrolase [Xanthomonadaceae bacterium]|nr:nucleoside triphosphate pyrophosphohydrolase [Xanthomonadaceae bacterium]